MLSDENRKLVERVFPELRDRLNMAAYPKLLNALLDAARSEPPADLKAVREALEPFASHLISDPNWLGDTPETTRVSVKPYGAHARYMGRLRVSDFRRAAEVYAALNLSETPAPGSLALGAVPEGGEERGASRDLETVARDLGGVANLLEHRMGTEEDRLVRENSRQAAATCRSVAALLKALVAHEVTG